MWLNVLLTIAVVVLAAVCLAQWVLGRDAKAQLDIAISTLEALEKQMMDQYERSLKR